MLSIKNLTKCKYHTFVKQSVMMHVMAGNEYFPPSAVAMLLRRRFSKAVLNFCSARSYSPMLQLSPYSSGKPSGIHISNRIFQTPWSNSWPGSPLETRKIKQFVFCADTVTIRLWIHSVLNVLKNPCVPRSCAKFIRVNITLHRERHNHCVQITTQVIVVNTRHISIHLPSISSLTENNALLMNSKIYLSFHATMVSMHLFHSA